MKRDDQVILLLFALWLFWPRPQPAVTTTTTWLNPLTGRYEPVPDVSGGDPGAAGGGGDPGGGGYGGGGGGDDWNDYVNEWDNPSRLE